MRTRAARFKYRAYPTDEQIEWLAQSFGCARVVYNDYIYQREQNLKNGTPVRTSLTSAYAEVMEEWKQTVEAHSAFNQRRHVEGEGWRTGRNFRVVL